MPKFIIKNTLPVFVTFVDEIEADDLNSAVARWRAGNPEPIGHYLGDTLDGATASPAAQIYRDQERDPAFYSDRNAAPALLAALKGLWDILPPIDPADPRMAAYDAARLAIDNATR